MPATVVETPCKVNLHLGVHAEKDVRGYHRVDSVMVPVALFDAVRVDDAPALSVSFSPALGTAPEKTGVWRAAELLARELGREPDVRVEVRTRIPEHAGLGGSSADAGATLRALAARWGVGPRDERVVRVARRVGADVAFFLRPEPSLLTGAGDVLERTFPSVELPLALVMPNAPGGSTVEAYAEFDRAPVAPGDPSELCAALAAGDAARVTASLSNNLAPAARALCPEAGEVEDWLRGRPGVLAAQITGSGTCSFAVCASSAAADSVVADAVARGWRAWSTKTVGSCGEVC
ncbi:4-(cytidine 5'-diphospho)-2-C-methyl-D-erythritol kinase [Thermophilibacter sp.]